MNQFDMNIKLTPLTNGISQEQVDDSQWLENSDEKLLAALDSHIGEQDSADKQEAVSSSVPTVDGECYTVSEICLKQSQHGFVLLDNGHEYFLNDGDMISLGELNFAVTISKIPLRTSNNSLALNPMSSTTKIDDIWGGSPSQPVSYGYVDNSNVVATTSEQSASQNSLNFLHQKPIEQFMPNLYQAPAMNTQPEPAVDLNSVIPLNPVQGQQAMPLVAEGYTPTGLQTNQFQSGTEHTINGNILRELGIDAHASQILQETPQASSQTFLEQSPLDMADEFLRDDMQLELQQSVAARNQTAYLPSANVNMIPPQAAAVNQWPTVKPTSLLSKIKQSLFG